jgi:hypothetical protein
MVTWPGNDRRSREFREPNEVTHHAEVLAKADVLVRLRLKEIGVKSRGNQRKTTGLLVWPKGERPSHAYRVRKNLSQQHCPKLDCKNSTRIVKSMLCGSVRR